MELSKEAIEEFREIYYQEFGDKLSDEKARRIGEGLLELLSIVYPFESLRDTSGPDNRGKNLKNRNSGTLITCTKGLCFSKLIPSMEIVTVSSFRECHLPLGVMIAEMRKRKGTSPHF